MSSSNVDLVSARSMVGPPSKMSKTDDGLGEVLHGKESVEDAASIEDLIKLLVVPIVSCQHLPFWTFCSSPAAKLGHSPLI